MKSDLNNIFIIPVLNDFLIYAPLSDISALVNRTAAIELKQLLQMTDDNKPDPGSSLYELAKKISRSTLHHPVQRKGELNPEFLGIIPTRLCNSACCYCDFGADLASAEKMTYELATKAVDWYADLLKLNQNKIMDIHFFGGEPMLARDVIEVVVQRARILAAANKMVPYFEISTNGQYSTRDARYLGHYFDKIILSFDGFSDIQNRHRPLKAQKDSYENVLITAEIISNSNAELCIRCCVSHENLSRMEEFTQWLCENLRLTAINFESLAVTPQSFIAGLKQPDPVDFAVHFQKSREIAEKYGVSAIYSSDINTWPVVSSCPVGKDTVIISPDRRISNCYLQPEKWQKVGLNLDFGSFKHDGNVKIDKSRVNEIREMVRNKPRCNKCFCRWSCAGGCHVGITYPGSGHNYDNYCTQTRLISAFTLLSNLNANEKIDRLIESPEAFKQIVNSPTDSIMDLTT